MRKTYILLIISGLLLIASCKKNSASVGSWKFQGTTYGASSAVYVPSNNSLLANTSSTTNSGSLAIYFPYQPSGSATYKVVNYTGTLDSNQLYVQFINGSNNFYYYSTGTDNASAKVTVASSGKITVSINSAELANYFNPVPDSAQITATITQQ